MRLKIPMGSKEKDGRGRPRKMESALSRWIDAKGMTRDDLAAKLGVHRSTVDRLCRGDRRPNLSLAFQIEKLSKGEVPASIWAKVPPHSAD